MRLPTPVLVRLAPRLPVHYGWLIVVTGIVSNMVAGGALFWGVSLFLPRIADDFGTGRTPVITVFVIGQTVYALVGPFAGRYIDAHGVRTALVAGAIGMPLAFLATSRAETLWQLAIGWSLVGVVRSFVMPVPFNWLITRWFEGRRRQVALGVVTIGFGLGGAVVLPLLSALVDRTDWHAGMIACGIALGLVQGIAGLCIVADRPWDVGLQPNVAADELRADSDVEVDEWGYTTAQALRMPAFWFMALAMMLFFLSQASVITLALDFFDSRGVAAGAGILGATALFSTLSRLPLGIGLGRVQNVYRLATLVACGQAVAVGALVLTTSAPGLVFWVVLWGMGSAFAPMLESLLTARAFGVRHFGALSGIVGMVSLAGQNIGSIGGAAMYDVTGSYTVPFALYAAAFGTCALLLVLFARAVSRQPAPVPRESPLR